MCYHRSMESLGCTIIKRRASRSCNASCKLVVSAGTASTRAGVAMARSPRPASALGRPSTTDSLPLIIHISVRLVSLDSSPLSHVFCIIFILKTLFLLSHLACSLCHANHTHTQIVKAETSIVFLSLSHCFSRLCITNTTQACSSNA